MSTPQSRSLMESPRALGLVPGHGFSWHVDDRSELPAGARGLLLMVKVK